MSIHCLRRWVSVLPLLALGACAMNSNPAEITVYHGQGNSQAVSYEIGTQGLRSSSQRQLQLGMPEGTRVCLNVLNAHTPGFDYKLRVSVDSASPTPPDFGGLLALLTTVIPNTSAAATDRLVGGYNLHRGRTRFNGYPEDTWVSDYKQKIDTLRNEMQLALDAIRLSMLPETLLPGAGQTAAGEHRGLRYAQETISTLSSGTGHFNDPELQKTIDAWKNAAAQHVKGISDGPAVVEAFHQQAVTLLTARDAIRSIYPAASASWRDCRALTTGTTTINLAAVPRSTVQFTGQRDTGSLVQITATSDYRRNVVEIVPLAFLAFPRNVTGFGILNDTVVEDVKYAESGSFRVGTMVTTTPLRFGPSNEWAFGPGIGTGLIGGDKPALSDFFLGGLISWRDWLRMGVGYGVSQAPARLINGAAVGRQLPLGDGREKLSDFIENQRVGTWFLTFTINGLKINLP